MKVSRLFVLTSGFLLASSLIPAPTDSVPVMEGVGRIRSVTVFPDRAIVERSLSVSTEGKPQRIRFVQLPATMLPDTIRVSAESAQILSIAGKKRPEDSSNPSLAKRLSELQIQIREETDRITNLQDQIKSLNSFAISEQNDSSPQLRSGALSTEALAKALQFFEEQRASYLKRIAASELRRSDLQKELKELSSGKRNRTSPVEIEVTFVGKQGAEATISLSCMVDSVSYKTEYDLYGTTGGTDFLLKSSAIIRQSTGEDWKDARITLSSARPRLSLSPGMLHPWRLTAQSAVRTGEQAKQDEPEKSASGEDSASFAITLSAPLTVNSDAESYRIGLSEAPLTGSIDHVAIPSISSAVFLRARMKNDTGRPLLWDAVQIFLDGSFTGTVRPDGSVASGADFELFLGSDQRIQISRTLLRGDVVGSGLIEKTVEIENTWQIEISNHTKKIQRITVLDQFPVSADPRITSKFHGSSRPDVKSDANGMLSWQIVVNPGTTERFDFGYSIEMTREIFEQIRQSSPGTNQRRPASPSENAPAKQQFNLERMLNK